MGPNRQRPNPRKKKERQVPLSEEPLIVVHNGRSVNINTVPAFQMSQLQKAVIRRITTIGEYGVVVLSNAEMAEARKRGLPLQQHVFRILDENRI